MANQSFPIYVTVCLFTLQDFSYKCLFVEYLYIALYESTKQYWGPSKQRHYISNKETLGIGTISIVSDSNLIIQTFVLSTGGTKRKHVVPVQTSLHSTDLVPATHAQTIANNQMAASVQFWKSISWFHSWDHSRAHSDTASVGICDTCRIGSSGI